MTNYSTEEEVENTISTIEKIDVQICFDYSYEGISKNEINESNHEEIREKQRKNSKLFHSTKNRELVNNLNLEDYDKIEVDNYAPYVTYSFDNDIFIDSYSEIIDTILNADSIDTAYIKPVEQEETNASFPRACTTSNVSSMMSRKDYTGKGVKVGIIDCDGVIDTSNVNIEASLVTNRDEWYWIEGVSKHATQTASIIGGKYGIAPNAELLGVELVGDASSEVGWLLDNQVDIINMSYGDTDATGEYSSKSAYMDYIARTNWVSFVGSAGNSGNYISNPGLGYNVISVGATDSFGQSKASYSAYTVKSGAHKPNLVAPSGFVLPNTNETIFGTSFSAPMVTGALALLMEEFPTLDSFPEIVSSILASSANSMTNYTSRLSSGLNDLVGAGMLNYESAREAMRNRITFSNASDNYRNNYLTKKMVYLNAGDTIKVALSWFINKENSSSTSKALTDYDLKLLDSNGYVLKSAASSTSNLEVIEFEATSSGYYYLGLYQYGYVNTIATDWGAMSYCIN